MAKTVLITGASRGIGAACARAFKRDKYDVVINYRCSREKARSLSDELSCRAFGADVSDFLQMEEMARHVGDVDVLVCNAGIDMQKMFADTTPEDWRRMFAVNVDGVYNACKLFVPHMVHQKWGRIIVVSSMWGIRGASCEVAYSTSKAALLGFTKSLAKELGPSGITVNCIAPGVIDTDMNADIPAEIMDELQEETPVCRLGKTEDVAELAIFLASERASFITGQIISADGGFAI